MVILLGRLQDGNQILGKHSLLHVLKNVPIAFEEQLPKKSLTLKKTKKKNTYLSLEIKRYTTCMPCIDTSICMLCIAHKH